MNSLCLFTIPSWMPFLPPEIWAIIFHWKWLLENKEINKELLSKMKNYNTYVQTEYCSKSKNWSILGNYWFYKNNFNEYVDRFRVVGIIPKCGIEFMNLPSINEFKTYMNQDDLYIYPAFSSKDSLRKHITENLGITCSKTLDWNEMTRLSRTV